MPKEFTPAIQAKIVDDRALFKIVGDITDLPPRLLYFYVRRNAKTVNEQDVVEAIANFLNVPSSTLQNEVPRKPRKPRKPRQLQA